MKNKFERLSSDNLRYMLNSDSIVSTLGYKELLNEVLITRKEDEELQQRIAELTAELAALREQVRKDEGLVLCARMMKPILEETRLLLGKAEVVR